MLYVFWVIDISFVFTQKSVPACNDKPVSKPPATPAAITSKNLDTLSNKAIRPRTAPGNT